MLPPPAQTKPKMPIAFARSPGSVKIFIMSDSAIDDTTAPPSPCTALAAISSPWEFETPQTTEANVKSAMPRRNKRRWP